MKLERRKERRPAGVGDRSLLHQWEGRCFQYAALYPSVLEAYRGEPGQLTTSLLCSSVRKGKSLCRVPTCTTT